MSSPFCIAVAVQNDKSCYQAVEFAVDLGQQLKMYKLYFVYVVATNPEQNFPIIDRLEKSYNMEVHEEGKRDMIDLFTYLDNVTTGKVSIW
jgi:hypothetical protein